MNDRKKQIIQTAIRDFSIHGIPDVSMCEIAFDSGISIKELTSVFPNKETLADEVFSFIPSCIELYEPAEEDILEMLRTQSAYEILQRYSNVRHRDEDRMQGSITRLLYLEQYRSERSRSLLHEYYVSRPIEVLERILNVLQSQHRIPPCDSRAIAEMWQRTALMYELKWIHGITEGQGYAAMNQFFVSLIIQGTVPALSDRSTIGNIISDLQDIDWTGNDKGRIRMKALECFAELGYENTGFSLITDALGLNERDILCFYSDKKDIFLDLSRMLSATRSDCENLLFCLKNGRTDLLFGILAGLRAPKKKKMTGLLYRVLIQEQFFHKDLRDIFLLTLQQDCAAVDDLMKDLNPQTELSSDEKKNISIVLVYSLCSFFIEETVFPEINGQTELIRLHIASTLIGVILNGFLLNDQHIEV